MLIFWHQGGLHIEPEGEQERKALVTLVENLKFAKPKRPLMGSSVDGADKLLKTLGQTGSSQSKKPDPKQPDAWWGTRPDPADR
jgi:hypothetical protein